MNLSVVFYKLCIYLVLKISHMVQKFAFKTLCVSFPYISFLVLPFLPDQNNKRIVLALQSGLKSELTWALNTLTLLSFKEKDDMRKDATALAKIPGLLDALLQVVCLPICTFVIIELTRENLYCFEFMLWFCCTFMFYLICIQI